MALNPDQRSQVFQALGQASSCWTDLPEAGIFMSDLCVKIGDELVSLIEEWIEDEKV